MAHPISAYSVTLWTPQFTTLYIVHILWCAKYGNGHTRIPGTCGHIKWPDTVKLRLISWPGDGEMDYLPEPRQSQGNHEWRRQEGKTEPERQLLETDWAWLRRLWGWRKGPWANEHRDLWTLAESRTGFYPGASGKKQRPAHTTLAQGACLDIWPPDTAR